MQIFQNKLKTQNTKIAEMTKQSELKDKIISAAKENLEKIQNERDKKVQELEVSMIERIHCKGFEIKERWSFIRYV